MVPGAAIVRSALHGQPATGAACGSGANTRLNDLAFERVAALFVLDLDDPEVGVAFYLTLDVGAGIGFGHQGALLDAEPGDVAVDVAGLVEQLEGAVEQVELDDEGAAPGVALAQHGGEQALVIAAPQMRAHPELGRQTPVGGHSCAARATARICDRVWRGVSTSALSRISISDGLPALAQRSKAGAKSA